jgi:PAS domain S-box-containing protein
MALPPARPVVPVEERLRLIVDALPDLISYVGADGRYELVNRAYQAWFGRRPDEVVGRHMREVLGDGAWAALRPHVEAALAGRPARFETELPYKYGPTRWVRVTYAPHVAAGGAVLGFAVLVDDISAERRQQAALRESEERYRAFVANSTEGVYRVEFDPPVDTALPPDEQVAAVYRAGRFAECNDAFARMYGFARAAEVVGRGLDLMLPPDDPAVRAYLRAVMAAGYRAADVESAERDRFGNPVHFANSLSGVVEGGRLVRVWGTQRDVTGRVRAEAGLRASEERFRRAADAVDGIIYEYDARTGRVERSRGLFEVLGYRPEDVPPTADWWHDQVHPDDRRRLAALPPAAGGHQTAAYRVRHRDGRWLHVEDRAVLVRDAAGAVTRTVGCTQDVTERVRAEEQLRRNSETFSHLVENAPFGVYVVDADFRLAQVSAGARKAFRNVRPLLGRDFAEVMRVLWPDPFASEAIGRFRHTLATGEPYRAADTTERRADTPDTESYDWKIERVVLPDGRFGVVCYFYDLTERRQAELDARFLADLGEQVRTAADADRLLAGAAAAVGRHLRLDRCYLAEVDEARDRWWVRDDYRNGLPSVVGEYRLSDYPAGPVADLRAGRVLAVEDAGTDPRTAAHYAAGYQPLGVRGHVVVPLTRGGRWVATLVAATSAPRRWEEREVRLLETVAERTWNAVEKRRLDAGLREGERRLRLAQEAGRVGVFEWLIPENRIVWSAELEALYGLPEGGFEGTYADWEKRVVPEDARAVGQGVKGCLRDRATEYGYEFRAVRPDGSVRWLAGRAQFHYDAAGRPLRMIGVNVDVDDRKRAEEALRDADRRKNEFLAALAHELRNPLAPVRTGLEVMRANGDAPAAVRPVREMMERQVAQMARLIDDLMDVARITRGKITLRPEPTDLAAVVAAAVEASAPLVEAGGHRLTVALPPAPVRLTADPARLTQVLSNLLSNAAKYTDPGGRIWLSAGRVPGAADPALELRVRDNGVGIPAGMLARVFDPFTQVDGAADRSRDGLGIGLTLVRTLVELHGGTVEARSDGPGTGSEFVVRLPLGAGPEPAPPPPAPAPPPGPPRRVLVVDDNEDAADTLAALLSLTGHEARAAYDGPAALAAAGEFRPEVVLTDLGMPGMDGYELARRFRAEPAFRGVVLVAVTGWGQDEDRRRTAEAGFDHHLVKPVAPDAVRRLLAAPG